MVSDSSAVRRLAARLLQVERGLRNVSTVPQLGRSSLDDEALTLRDGDGNVMGRVGRQLDGTYGSTTLDGPTPVAPASPVASGGPGSLTVEWDGQFKDGTAAPLDFHVVEIYVATEPFSDTADARLLGHFSNEAGGEITVARPKGEQHVGLVTKARSGKRSELSPLATAEVESVVDQETVDELNDALENMPSITWLNRAPEPADGEGKPVGAVWRELNDAGEIVGEFEWDGAAWVARPISGDAVTHLEVGKLTAAFSQLDEVVANRIFADIFAANQVTAVNIDTETLGADAGFIGVLNSAEIVGAIIKTAATGMRVELDSPNGIRIYNTDNEAVLSADSNGDLILGGDISLSGQVTTGTENTYAQLSQDGLALTSDEPILEGSWPTHRTASGLTILNERVYVAAGLQPYTIDVYELDGTNVDSWEVNEKPDLIANDGQYIVTARNGYKSIYVYNTSGTLVRTITPTLQPRLLGAAKGLIFIASNQSEIVEVRNASSGALVRNITFPARVTKLSVDDDHIVWVHSATVELYTHAGSKVREFKTSKPLLKAVKNIGSDKNTVFITIYTTLVGNDYDLMAYTKTGENLGTVIIGKSDALHSPHIATHGGLAFVSTGSNETVDSFDMQPGRSVRATLNTQTGRLEATSAVFGGTTDVRQIRTTRIGPGPSRDLFPILTGDLGPRLIVNRPILPEGYNIFPSEEARDRALPRPPTGTEAYVATGLINTTLTKWVRVNNQWVKVWDEETTADTGWVDLAYLPGYSAGTAGQLAYRAKNGWVALRGGATGDIEAGSYTRVNADLIPQKYRPAMNFRIGGFGTGQRPTAVEVHPNGQILLGWTSSGGITKPGWFSAGCSWPIENE